MRRKSNSRGWLARVVLGALATLYVTAPVYAFTPSDSPLISAGAVTPNVMLLVDDSGSMNNLIRAADFDQSVRRSDIFLCDGSNLSRTRCDVQYIVDMNSENLFYSSFRRGTCGFGYSGFTRGFSNDVWCLALPDPVGGGDTRYSTRYISWLMDNMGSSRTKNYTDGTIPTGYRMQVAKDSATALVAANRNLRIGLATFYSPLSRGDYGIPADDRGPGGYIARAIADLSATSDTTTNAANTNFNRLNTAISNLSAVANTPLAETYYEVTRYFRGMVPFYPSYNSGATAYTSPVQYRCQKNYGVVITDGLPTFDRTFPTITAQDSLAAGRLPNWDGDSTTDGDDINGDGEGDTLYLDDIAKFASDIDMFGPTGTDNAGKSWNATDFPKQNISTYTVGFTASNQMLYDAAVKYGNGKYYQATDATGLSAALTSALNDISSKAGSGGAGTSDSTTLTTTSRYYKTLYDPSDWSGTIQALGLNTDGSVNATDLKWTTDNTISVATPGSPSYQSWNTASNAAINLVFDSFSLAQRTTLNNTGMAGVTGADLVEWSKGTNKAGLKVRTRLLGDIINSPLVYASPVVGTASDTPGDNSYSTFLAAKRANMSASLVVNANDGLVNVIGTDGKRRFGYMPSSVLSGLRLVADPGYINGTTHKFLVDGPINVVDGKIGTSWKTMALGGVGAGGKTYYALQLFEAASGSATGSNNFKALWELSATSFLDISPNSLYDLGYAYSKPEVARLPDGTWAAFIANGYGGGNGRAALYVVNLATGAVINKIMTPIVNLGESDNGLSSVKLRVNSQNVVQAAYGGDLKGRMWKFDFTSSSNGAVAFGGKPLFTASGGANQPITVQPVIGNYTQGRKIIYFGTGKLSESADKTSTTRQAFYAVMDNDGATANYTESSLQAQAIVNIDSTGGVTTTGNDVDYTAKRGFYLPLTYGATATGERVIYPAQLIDGRIYFSTAILDTSDPCSSSGSGKLMEIDAVSGKMITNMLVLGRDTNVAGIVIGTGIPNFTSALGNTDGATGDMTQTMTAQDGAGNTYTYTEKGPENSRRIMWRQRQ